MTIKKTMLAFLLASVGLAGCINDAEVSNGNVSIDDGDGNVRFLIETSAISALTRSAETSGDYESGTYNEFVVKKLDVYYFHSSTKMFVGRIPFNALTKELGDENVSGTDPNMTTVVYKTQKADIEPGQYDFFAVANAKDIYVPVDVDEFINNIDATTYEEGNIAATDAGFLMTNRATENLNISVREDNSGVPTSITFSMERAVAKIEIGQNISDDALKTDAGKVYARMNLAAYKVVNLPSKFYTFRHVATLTNLTSPTFDLNTHFGSIPAVNGYAIDPYFFKKNEDAGSFDNRDGYYIDAMVNLSTDNWPGMPTSNEKASLYSLENCMIRNAQKNAYTTGIVFKVAMSPNNNVFKLDDNGALVQDNDKAAIIYYFNYNFYSSLAALKKAGVKNINVNADYTDKELSTFSVKRFKLNSGSYDCFYNYWIKHLSQDAVMGVMEFGIVRNNLYRMKITGFSGLGSGIPDIDPDKPDEPNSYIDVAVEVKPWIVRDQGGDINL